MRLKITVPCVWLEVLGQVLLSNINLKGKVRKWEEYKQ